VQCTISIYPRLSLKHVLFFSFFLMPIYIKKKKRSQCSNVVVVFLVQIVKESGRPGSKRYGFSH
jgi:hypothetical protein